MLTKVYDFIGNIRILCKAKGCDAIVRNARMGDTCKVMLSMKTSTFVNNLSPPISLIFIRFSIALTEV